MYAAKVLVALAATTIVSASAIDARHFGAIDIRSVAQGWSLQASTCPADSTACSSGGCCPSSLTCNDAANLEVSACCTSGDCRGDVEGSPTCADSSWSLYKGLNGNGFCCEVGKVGVMDYSSGSMTCVSSGDVGSSSTAELVSTGSGASSTSSAVKASTTTVAAKTTTTAKAASTTAASSASATAASKSSASVASSSSSASAASASSASATSSGTSSATSANASSAGSASSGAGQLTVGFASVVAGFLAVFAL